MAITVMAKVLDWSPQGWRVELENGSISTCTVGGRLKKAKINIAKDDIVDAELGEYDLSHGRIVWRRK